MKTKITEILKEAAGDTLFRDAHANIDTDLDAIISGGIEESCENTIEEAPRRDWKARAKSFLDNDLFVDFDNPLDEAAPSELEYEITYRFGRGPINIGYLFAEDENEARESFLDYLADNDEIKYDDDVTILKIKRA